MPAITRTALLIINLLFIATLHAQVKVKGLLGDSTTGKPVAFATVGLYRLTDKQKPLQNVFSSRKGEYEFTKVARGTYVVIATYTGYLEKETTIIVDSIDVSVPSVPLTPQVNEMKAVTVSAAIRKPLIEQEDEKLIFNAEADPSLEGLTALDVLRKTPLLAVDGDGNVSMNGKTSFKVLLNGKETAMFSRNVSEALKSFPASMVKSVEVITNPSARYDGEGTGGIINIITQKKVAGYNGNLGVSWNTLNSASVNTSINVKYGKFGLSAYYSAGLSRSPDSYSYSETESLNPVAWYKRISDGRSRNRSRYNFGSLELSMDIDSLNTISTYYNLSGWGGRSYSESLIDVIAPDRVTVQTDQFDNRSRYRMPSMSAGSDFVHKSGRVAGKEIAFKIYLEHSLDNNHSVAEQEIAGLDRFIRNDNRSPGNSATFETNFVQPFKKGKKLEAGVKLIHRNAESDYTSLLKFNEADDYFEDKSNTNNFNYNQQVYSAYATWSFKWKEISFKLGSRLERTHVHGDFINTATTVEQDYYTLLPNIFISRKIKKIHTFSLSFGRRLRRPYIWDLNPFVSNLDSLNLRYGNPDLGPDLSNNIELGYTVIKGKTSINLRFIQSFNNRQIINYTVFEEETGISRSMVANAGVNRASTLTGNVSTKLSKAWSLSVGANARFNRIRNRFDKRQDNQGLGGYINLNSSYQFNPRWTASVSAFVNRPDVQLQGQAGYFRSYNLSTSYKLFKNKITIAASANNFFSKYLDYVSRLADVNFLRYTENRNVQRSLNISLRWNFGKLSESVSRKRGINNDDLKAQ